MEEIQTIQTRLKTAAESLAAGNMKDAYFSYLNILELAAKELRNIKFVNNVVVLKPTSFNSLFNMSRTCLSSAEEIITKQNPLPPRRNPNLNIAIFPPTPQQEEHPHKTPPAVPPKPLRRSMKIGDIEISGCGRDAHVVSGEDDADSSDSDDEDDEYIGKRDSFLRRSDSLNVNSSIRRRSSSPSLTTTPRKRSNVTGGSVTDSPTDEESPCSSHITSPTTPASFYGAIAVPLSMPNLFDQQRPKMINVIPEEIPASPLLTKHSQLDQKIQTLESKLEEYRIITKRRKETGYLDVKNSDHPCSELSDEEIKDSIVKYGNTLLDLKRSITRSRKLVYKAASDPEILEFAPHMIAYQLTLIESAIFLEIDPLSLLSHSPKNPDSKITASTDFFNYLTRVIERSILLPLEASSRARVINHWVKVAVKLHELHNFQTLKAILSALGTPPIKRLKRTWICIPKKNMVKFEDLNELMSETRNYGKYREVMREGLLRKPTVPFLGTFIMDSTYLLAAVKTVGPTPVTPQLLQTLQKYQSGPKYNSTPPVSYIKASTKHHFRTATSISAALHRTGIWIPEKSVDELSCKREPHKHKGVSGSGRSSNPASWGGTTSNSIISNASSIYRGSTGSTVGGSGTSTGGNASTSSGMGRTGSTSGSGDSRPQNKMRDEKEKEDNNKSDKIKYGEIEKDMDENEEEVVTNSKRTSWRMGAMRVFGGYEHNDPQKSPTTMTSMLRSVSLSHPPHSPRNSVNFEVKSHAAATVTKVHARATNTNNPNNNSNNNSNNNNSNNTIKSKPFSYTSRRSLEETSISTPPPLLPKPATLMQRSSSSSSISSMGSVDGTTIITTITSTNTNANTNGSVASEVAAGGGALERNWQ
ncbi:3535_t:CDS:10 [Diversispora eburnea]|uniref:3535_t:CDS:1 n=1 Tax=Diversispora eburnea TaxID=1213867 RepID=A0A9N9FK73_9GLOM|nr:3535_t:CDS:10 [Diversispora eburnea]